MSDLIQWPRAKWWEKQWNPVIGCKPCSPACEHCYAAAWAKRFGQSFEPHATKQKPPRSGIVFCGNMTDLFGEWNDCNAMSWFIEEANWNTDATYLWLTKRVDRMMSALERAEQQMTFLVYDSPHYFGFTAENQEWYDRRIFAMHYLLPRPNWGKWWVSQWWVSCEPLLSPIHLHFPCDHYPSWVVVGCESGPNRRPCKIEWVESIVEQCRAAKVPVFVKQLDAGGKCETDINKFPEHLRIRQVPWARKGE